MAEVINVVVAFAVIFFFFRWISSSSDSPEEQKAIRALGFRPKKVTQQMVDTLHDMFPDIPIDNIRYDLLRSGSVESTSNKILQQGFLTPPSQGYYTIYPLTPSTPGANSAGQATPTATSPATTSVTTGLAPVPRGDNLILRYKLQDRISSASTSESADAAVASSPEVAGGKATWEDSAEKREKSLQERKAQMILAARQRLLAQQANSTAPIASTSSS